MAALVAATLIGALTLMQTASWPATLLAALAAAGATVPALHHVLAS